MNKLKFKLKSTILLLFAIALPAISIFQTTPVSADTKGVGSLPFNQKLYDQLSTRQHYYWLNYCFEEKDIDHIPDDEMSKWDFFNRYGDEGSGYQSVLGSMWGQGDKSTRECRGGAVVKNAFNRLGYTNPREAFCSLRGAEFDGNTDYATCIAGIGANNNVNVNRNGWDNGRVSPKDTAKSFRDLVKDKVPSLTPPMEYMRAYSSLIQQCKVQLQGPYEAGFGAASNKYQVPTVVQGDDGTYEVKMMKGVGVESSNEMDGSVALAAATSYSANWYNFSSANRITCSQAAEKARGTAGAYATYINKKSNGETIPPGGDDRYGDDNTEETSSCDIDGIGWMICPVMTFMGKVTDAAYGVVDNFLRFDARIIDDDSLRAAWSTFRNIANILFVLAFLVLIYSQMTGLGLNNYGVKKMMPKLIVAAILVNVSLWLCAIAVDISNILGASLKSLFDNLPVSTGDSGATTIEKVGQGLTWGIIMLGILTAGALLLMSVALPVILAALLAIAMILLILMLRQALIILLIVVSPIAFVAYLLPNTEQWFKKWMKLFGSLLMLYPIVAVVFGASAFAANLVANVGSGDITSGGLVDGNEFLQITALGIATVPLFVVPGLLKGALNATGTLGAKLGGLSGKATARVGKKAMTESRLGEAKHAFDRRKLERQVRRRTGQGWVARNTANKKGILGAVNAVADPTRLDNTKLGAYLGGSIGAAQAKARLSKLQAENIDIEKGHVKDLNATALKGIINDSSSTDERKAAALDRLVKVSDSGDYVDEINSAIRSDSSVIRSAAASALESHGPGWIKASDIDNISTGEAGKTSVNLQSIAKANVGNGVLSQEKMVNESAGDLKFAWDNAELAGKQRMVDTAHALKNNDQLSGKIKHNATAIDKLASATSP